MVMRPSGAGRALMVLCFVLCALGSPARAQRVEVTLKSGVGTAPVTGRLFVIFTRDNSREPRLQAGGYNQSVPFFAIDVDALGAGASASITSSALGFPVNSLKDVPAGRYYVQALLNVYTKVTPKHGKTIWVHWDQWEGQR